MTVAELIQQLQDLPPKALVVIVRDLDGSAWTCLERVTQTAPQLEDLDDAVPVAILWPTS